MIHPDPKDDLGAIIGSLVFTATIILLLIAFIATNHHG
jgi:Ca2+/Na+ antiporter